MKAITIWQPWGSAIAIEAKGYETRSSRQKIRNPEKLSWQQALSYPAKTLIQKPAKCWRTGDRWTTAGRPANNRRTETVKL